MKKVIILILMLVFNNLSAQEKGEVVNKLIDLNEQAEKVETDKIVKEIYDLNKKIEGQIVDGKKCKYNKNLEKAKTIGTDLMTDEQKKKLRIKLKTDNVTETANKVPEDPDTNHYFFRIGSAFDFLNSTLSFNKVYGELRYYDNNIVKLEKLNNTYLGFEMGGYTGNSLTEVRKDYVTKSESIDYTYLNDDSIKVLTKTGKYKVNNGYAQLSLFVNPYLNWNLNANFKIGLGISAEMYRYTNFTKFTNEEILRTDTNYYQINSGTIIRTFRDSIGSTFTDGYFGISCPISIFSKHINVRIKSEIGLINRSNTNRLNYAGNSFQNNSDKFYLIDACFYNPKSKISIQANIRGLFPNYAPVFGVYVSKSFDLDKIYEAVTN